MLSILGKDIKSVEDLALIGEGEIAYIRQISSEEVNERFPLEQKLEPGQNLWALFSADGTPIYLSDDRTSTFFAPQRMIYHLQHCTEQIDYVN